MLSQTPHRASRPEIPLGYNTSGTRRPARIAPGGSRDAVTQDRDLHVRRRALHAKAAALLHSIARNHALVDGNKRLALASFIGLDGMNGITLTLSNDKAYDLVIAVAAGKLNDVPQLASRLEAGTTGR
jgi:Fic/DOC family